MAQARLVRCFRRTLLSSSCPKPLAPPHNATTISLHQKQQSSFAIAPNSLISRYYISEMRKSAFEGNLLRLIRHEIQYELDRSPEQSITEFESFTIDDRPGDQWITLKRQYEGGENIKIEATMFDWSVPTPGPSGGVDDEVRFHLTFIVSISKGTDDEVLEIMCSAWPDSIDVKKLFIRQHNKMLKHPYAGPSFKELDDEMQDTIYEFLEERGISDELAVFLHEYMKNKDKTEYIRWMGTVKSYIEKK